MKYLEQDQWLSFYNELDAGKRFVLYEKISAEKENDDINVFRKKLIDYRYNKIRKTKEYGDKCLMEIVLLLAHSNDYTVFSRSGKKKILQAMKNLGLQEIPKENEIQRALLYWELRNVAKRYYETTNSVQYGKKFFGTQDSSREEKLARTAKDVEAITVKIPQIFDLEKEMEIFSDAFIDEFEEFSALRIR